MDTEESFPLLSEQETSVSSKENKIVDFYHSQLSIVSPGHLEARIGIGKSALKNFVQKKEKREEVLSKIAADYKKYGRAEDPGEKICFFCFAQRIGGHTKNFYKAKGRGRVTIRLDELPSYRPNIQLYVKEKRGGGLFLGAQSGSPVCRGGQRLVRAEFGFRG